MRKLRTNWVVVLGAVLALAGIGTVLYNLWPDIMLRTGLLETTRPYPSNFAESDVATASAGGGRHAGRKTVSSRPPTDSRVVIPRIGVDVKIYEGDPDRALYLGVYHHAGTALPGESGNLVIAGHRNRRQFALLSYLKPGNVVSVWWNGQEHGYRVQRVYTVDAIQSSILARGDTEMLTLYTCTPRFLGNKRTVVIASPLAPDSGG